MDVLYRIVDSCLGMRAYAGTVTAQAEAIADLSRAHARIKEIVPDFITAYHNYAQVDIEFLDRWHEENQDATLTLKKRDCDMFPWEVGVVIEGVKFIAVITAEEYAERYPEFEEQPF